MPQHKKVALYELSPIQLGLLWNFFRSGNNVTISPTSIGRWLEENYLTAACMLNGKDFVQLLKPTHGLIKARGLTKTCLGALTGRNIFSQVEDACFKEVMEKGEKGILCIRGLPKATPDQLLAVYNNILSMAKKLSAEDTRESIEYLKSRGADPVALVILEKLPIEATALAKAVKENIFSRSVNYHDKTPPSIRTISLDYIFGLLGFYNHLYSDSLINDKMREDMMDYLRLSFSGARSEVTQIDRDRLVRSGLRPRAITQVDAAYPRPLKEATSLAFSSHRLG